MPAMPKRPSPCSNVFRCLSRAQPAPGSSLLFRLQAVQRRRHGRAAVRDGAHHAALAKLLEQGVVPLEQRLAAAAAGKAVVHVLHHQVGVRDDILSTWKGGLRTAFSTDTTASALICLMDSSLVLNGGSSSAACSAW